MQSIFPIIGEGARTVGVFLGLWAALGALISIPFARWLRYVDERHDEAMEDLWNDEHTS